MEGNDLTLETKGYCLACLKKSTAQGQTDLKIESLNGICNYLDIDSKKVFGETMPSLANVETSTAWELKAAFCAECFQSVFSVPLILKEIDRLQEMLQVAVKNIHDNLKGTEEKSVSKEFRNDMLKNPMSVFMLGIAEQLRTKLLNGCESKLKQFNEKGATVEKISVGVQVDAALLETQSVANHPSTVSSVGATLPPPNPEPSTQENVNSAIQQRKAKGQNITSKTILSKLRPSPKRRIRFLQEAEKKVAKPATRDAQIKKAKPATVAATPKSSNPSPSTPSLRNHFKCNLCSRHFASIIRLRIHKEEDHSVKRTKTVKNRKLGFLNRLQQRYDFRRRGKGVARGKGNDTGDTSNESSLE